MKKDKIIGIIIFIMLIVCSAGTFIFINYNKGKWVLSGDFETAVNNRWKDKMENENIIIRNIKEVSVNKKNFKIVYSTLESNPNYGILDYFEEGILGDLYYKVVHSSNQGGSRAYIHSSIYNNAGQLSIGVIYGYNKDMDIKSFELEREDGYIIKENISMEEFPLRVYLGADIYELTSFKNVVDKDGNDLMDRVCD